MGGIWNVHGLGVKKLAALGRTSLHKRVPTLPACVGQITEFEGPLQELWGYIPGRNYIFV